MKNRAYRRKQYAKRKRIWFRRRMVLVENDAGDLRPVEYRWGGNVVAGRERAARFAGFLANTPGWCSCWCCSDNRRRDGIPTLQEQRSADSMRQQIEELEHEQKQREAKRHQRDGSAIKARTHES